MRYHKLTEANKETLKSMIDSDLGYDEIKLYCHKACVSVKDAYEFIYDYEAPECCKGCIHTGVYNNMYPCNCCVRAHTKDFYERRNKEI